MSIGENMKILIKKMLIAIKEGDNPVDAINTTINCMEILLDVTFTEEEWNEAFNILASYTLKVFGKEKR